MDDIKVGIIVPIYNVAKYLDRCIQSIVDQTYSNIEIWLVDDCSTDSSYQIAADWSMRDSRIRLFKNDLNYGSGKTRNVAINKIFEENSTAYIAFVDSDDYIAPEYIEYLYDLCIQHKSEIAWIKNHVVSDQDQLVFFDQGELSPPYILSGKELLMRENDRIMYSMLWGKLFDISLWKDIRIAEDFRWYEDGATTFKVLYGANRIVISNIKLYYYCCSSNGNTRSELNVSRIQCGLRTALTKIDFYQERNETPLIQMAYIGYINTILNNMMKCTSFDKEKVLYKEMWHLYKKLYMIGLRCPYISIIQRSKYLLYRIFPWIRPTYIKCKCLLLGYR